MQLSNIIIVGDSFCASSNGWPGQLAKQLNLNLICHGVGGQPWWNARNFIMNISNDVINNTDIIVFAHTNADRLPTLNEQIGLVDHSNPGNDELSQAIKLHYKYIHDQEFLMWAHKQWFQEISLKFSNKKLVHLHCFPWSLPYTNLLAGMVVVPNLMAMSLNELGIEKFHLVDDCRSNHFNDHNNQELARQLAELIKNYKQEIVSLDISKFDQKINTWFTREGWS